MTRSTLWLPGWRPTAAAAPAAVRAAGPALRAACQQRAAAPGVLLSPCATCTTILHKGVVTQFSRQSSSVRECRLSSTNVAGCRGPLVLPCVAGDDWIFGLEKGSPAAPGHVDTVQDPAHLPSLQRSASSSQLPEASAASLHVETWLGEQVAGGQPAAPPAIHFANTLPPGAADEVLQEASCSRGGSEGRSMPSGCSPVSSWSSGLHTAPAAVAVPAPASSDCERLAPGSGTALPDSSACLASSQPAGPLPDSLPSPDSRACAVGPASSGQLDVHSSSAELSQGQPTTQPLEGVSARSSGGLEASFSEGASAEASPREVIRLWVNLGSPAVCSSALASPDPACGSGSAEEAALVPAAVPARQGSPAALPEAKTSSPAHLSQTVDAPACAWPHEQQQQGECAVEAALAAVVEGACVPSPARLRIPASQLMPASPAPGQEERPAGMGSGKAESAQGLSSPPRVVLHANSSVQLPQAARSSSPPPLAQQLDSGPASTAAHSPASVQHGSGAGLSGSQTATPEPARAQPAHGAESGVVTPVQQGTQALIAKFSAGAPPAPSSPLRFATSLAAALERTAGEETQLCLCDRAAAHCRLLV